MLRAEKAGIGDVQKLLVEREGKPVGTVAIVVDNRHFAALAVDAEDVILAELAFAFPTLIIRQDAVGRIGEPDRAIRFDHDIVRAVEPFALKTVGQHCDAAIVLGTGDAAAVLGGDKAAVTIDRIAIGVIGGVAEDRDMAVALVPAQQSVIRNVRPDQAASGRGNWPALRTSAPRSTASRPWRPYGSRR